MNAELFSNMVASEITSDDGRSGAKRRHDRNLDGGCPKLRFDVGGILVPPPNYEYGITFEADCLGDYG